MRMMKFRSLRRLALGLAIALSIVGLIIWIWVIPAVIVAAIRQRHEGYVTIAGWWINGSSAGVTGLTLHEEPAPGSPTWAYADRVATDLSLGGSYMADSRHVASSSTARGSPFALPPMVSR